MRFPIRRRFHKCALAMVEPAVVVERLRRSPRPYDQIDRFVPTRTSLRFESLIALLRVESANLVPDAALFHLVVAVTASADAQHVPAAGQVIEDIGFDGNL